MHTVSRWFVVSALLLVAVACKPQEPAPTPKKAAEPVKAEKAPAARSQPQERVAAKLEAPAPDKAEAPAIAKTPESALAAEVAVEPAAEAAPATAEAVVEVEVEAGPEAPVEVAAKADQPAGSAEGISVGEPAEAPAEEGKPRVPLTRTHPPIKKVDLNHDVAAGDKPASVEEATASVDFVAPELPPLELTDLEYPDFAGKRVAIIHTANVIGELAPCG